MSTTIATPTGFARSDFSANGVTRPLFTRGDGPGVVIIHEVPGITPQVIAFANRVADDGFFVALPVLFGVPGKPFGWGYNTSQIAAACVRKEFHVLASDRSSPITTFLRALCRDVHKQRGGPGVGAIGMCLTGNFALSLAVDESLMAPVLSQPSLPFPFSPSLRRGLHISPDDLAIVKRRCAADPGLKVIGLRFAGDPMCPRSRFDRLREEFGDSFEGIELPDASANPNMPGPAHSVVTNHLIDEEGEPTRAALDRVLSYFHERLDGG